MSLANVQEYEGVQEHRSAFPRVTKYPKGHSRLSLTISHPCKSCNNGWMSRLEAASALILRPMIEGKQRDLDAADVAKVQAWATKTALNFTFASEVGYTRPIDPQFAHQLFANRFDHSAVPNAQVWVAGYQPLGQFAYRHMTAQGYGTHPVTGRFHQVLRVVFMAGHAVFYVRLPDAEDAQGLGWRDPLPQFSALHGLPETPLSWSKDPLNDAGISETFNRHIHGGIYQGQDADVWKGK